ncbi:MAG TPA: serine hydrolase domain-containing protein [Vicinamibacterales bacterium]|nr:serine hydrolase domain-containing protein [Vicinamibacterales bacterium]
MRIAPDTRLVAGAVLAARLVATTQSPPAGWTDVRPFYLHALEQHAIVGSALAIVTEGGVIAARENAGLRDRDARLPVTNDTIFHWASITKTFTAIALMQLRDRGLVTLDDPIVKYVPELRKVSNPYGPMDAITLRHLLSHSAGFRAATWPWGTGEDWQPFEPPGWEQLVGMMPYTRIEFPPGSKYSYSNPGLIFIGRVIEDVAGEPYETYIDKQILRPLGMTRTFFDRAPAFLRADRSHSYFVTDEGIKEAPFDFDTGITVSNGGLNGPLDDLARYLGFLMGTRDAATQARYDAILKRASLEEMWRPVVPVSPGVSMGLTFFLERHNGLDFIAHSGGQNGFISHFYLHAPTRRAYLVAFNTQTTSAKAGDDRNTRALDAALRDVIIKAVFR